MNTAFKKCSKTLVQKSLKCNVLSQYWLEMMTLLKQSSATKIGCVPLFYREINVKCISFVEKRCWQESREGYRIEKNLLTRYVACKNTIRIWRKVLIHKNWMFKRISSLQKSFLELSPRDILTLTLDARNAYPLLTFSRWKYSESIPSF